MPPPTHTLLTPGRSAYYIASSMSSLQSVAAKWDALQALLPVREQKLDAEIGKQEADEALRMLWADKASV